VGLKINAALVVVIAGLTGLLALMPPSGSTNRKAGGG
jgi:hypothetical protein